MDSDIIHYEWSWDRISFYDFVLKSLAPHLNMMEAAGLKRPTFQDLQTLKMESTCNHGWIGHYFYMSKNYKSHNPFRKISVTIKNYIYVLLRD